NLRELERIDETLAEVEPARRFQRRERIARLAVAAILGVPVDVQAARTFEVDLRPLRRNGLAVLGACGRDSQQGDQKNQSSHDARSPETSVKPCNHCTRTPRCCVPWKR